MGPTNIDTHEQNTWKLDHAPKRPKVFGFVFKIGCSVKKKLLGVIHGRFFYFQLSWMWNILSKNKKKKTKTLNSGPQLWGGGQPQVVFLSCMPHRLRWSWFIEQPHFCSPDRKISSLYGLWLVRYDPIFEVMSGHIYSKFDIAPKAELWSKPLKLSVCNTGIGLYKSYISDFHIVDLRSGQFGDLPIVSDWAKNQVLKYLTHLFNSLRMMMNYLRVTRAQPNAIDRGGGGAYNAPQANSQTNDRSETGEAALERSRRDGSKTLLKFVLKGMCQVKVRSKVKIECFRILVLRTANLTQTGPNSAETLSKVRQKYCMSVNAILSTGQCQVTKGHYIEKSHCGHVVQSLLKVAIHGGGGATRPDLGSAVQFEGHWIARLNPGRQRAGGAAGARAEWGSNRSAESGNRGAGKLW